MPIETNHEDLVGNHLTDDPTKVLRAARELWPGTEIKIVHKTVFKNNTVLTVGEHQELWEKII